MSCKDNVVIGEPNHPLDNITSLETDEPIIYAIFQDGEFKTSTIDKDVADRIKSNYMNAEIKHYLYAAVLKEFQMSNPAIETQVEIA